VSPKNPFSFFCSPPEAAREEKEISGDTPDPGREDPAPLQGIHRFKEQDFLPGGEKNWKFFSPPGKKSCEKGAGSGN